MDNNNITNTTYLAELYRQTKGDTEAKVSMVDVGSAIGFDETEAKTTAENLMILGLVELKTLSGGIGITTEGLEELGITPSPASDHTSNENMQLGQEIVLDEKGRQVIENMLAELKIELASTKLEYPLLEENIIDIKTMEVQLLSPKPKIAIIREILRSLAATISRPDSSELSDKLATLLTN